MRKLGILSQPIPIDDANFHDSGIKDYEVISDSDPISNYFNYVGGYTHILNFEGSADTDPEPIAVSHEGNLIAAAPTMYKHPREETYDIDNQILLLPQPTKLQPNPQDLIAALVATGASMLNEERTVPLSGSPSGSAGATLPPLITSNIETELNKSQHGNEVKQHIEDGDACLENELWHPALSCYIHAIEWAFIAYIDILASIDIIYEEQHNNKNHYFAGRNPNLLTEVQNHNALSQTNESWISGRNRVERRWIAHHESGSILETDVKSVRARLADILTDLFT